jgi:hypothetical protein
MIICHILNLQQWRIAQEQQQPQQQQTVYDEGKHIKDLSFDTVEKKN